MKAVVATSSGAAVVDRSVPRLGSGEVLVRVAASALNRADLWLAIGVPHGRIGGLGAVLGLEWAGEVVAVGDDVAHHRRGDRVMGSGLGGFAEYVATDAGRTLPVPDGWDDLAQAAALPIALLTVHDALVTNGALRRDQDLLVHGASSAVGLMALEMARVLGAAVIAGTSTTAWKRSRLAAHGATHAFDGNDGEWPAAVVDATEGRGVDVVLDQVGGQRMDDCMRAAAVGATVVNVGRLAGSQAALDLDLHARRRIRYIGVTFRTRTAEELRTMNRRMLADLGASVANGSLRLPIDREFPLSDAPAALRYLADDQHFGKVVLRVKS